MVPRERRIRGQSDFKEFTGLRDYRNSCHRSYCNMVAYLPFIFSILYPLFFKFTFVYIHEPEYGSLSVVSSALLRVSFVYIIFLILLLIPKFPIITLDTFILNNGTRNVLHRRGVCLCDFNPRGGHRPGLPTPLSQVDERAPAVAL